MDRASDWRLEPILPRHKLSLLSSFRLDIFSISATLQFFNPLWPEGLVESLDPIGLLKCNFHSSSAKGVWESDKKVISYILCFISHLLGCKVAKICASDERETSKVMLWEKQKEKCLWLLLNQREFVVHMRLLEESLKAKLSPLAIWISFDWRPRETSGPVQH